MEEVNLNCADTAIRSDMPRISLVVPVYNTKEEYLRECLDSVCAQSFRDFEVILVDDGSTNNAGEVCDEYCRRDYRFKCIHQKNSRLPAARNRGIEHAAGEYIGFIDADDYIDKDYLQFLYGKASELDLDIAQCHALGWYPDDKRVDIAPMTDDETIVDSKEGIEQLILYSYNHGYLKKRYGFFNPAWGKLIRRRLLIDNGIMFDETASMVEDQIFNSVLLEYVEKIGIFKEVHYLYRQEGATSSKRFRASYVKEALNYLRINHENISKMHSCEEIYMQRFYCMCCAQFTGLMRLYFFHKDYPKERNRKKEMRSLLSHPYMKEAFAKAQAWSLASKECKLVYYIIKFRAFFLLGIIYRLRPWVKNLYIKLHLFL